MLVICLSYSSNILVFKKTVSFYASNCQGVDGAPSLDVMLLKLQVTGSNQGRPLNSDVLTAKAPHHAGAAMYMRSTTGCGTLAGPSLESEDCQ